MSAENGAEMINVYKRSLPKFMGHNLTRVGTAAFIVTIQQCLSHPGAFLQDLLGQLGWSCECSSSSGGQKLSHL